MNKSFIEVIIVWQIAKTAFILLIAMKEYDKKTGWRGFMKYFAWVHYQYYGYWVAYLTGNMVMR